MKPPAGLRFTRALAVLRLRRELERDSYPRIQMALIVTLTGGAGLLTSFALLRVGIGNMALRYPLALFGAYLVFLMLLWAWLRTKASDYDVPDFAGSDCSSDSNAAVGGDGTFGGGGSSGTFDVDGYEAPVEGESLSSLGETGGSVFDADEFAIPLIAVGLAIGLALASAYVIYLAPSLFAELLFDGALSYTLYRRLRKADNQHWLTTALGRTAIPFALTAIFLAIVGKLMTHYAPGAQSIGEVLRRLQS